MNKNMVIDKQRRINAEAKKIWEILTAPTTDWNGVTIETETDWKPGSEIIFSFVWDGKKYTDKGRVIEFKPERLLTHTYWSAFSGLTDEAENYSTVQYELVPDGQVTLLKLTHSDFATETMYEHSDKNWEDTLDKIKTQCEAAGR